MILKAEPPFFFSLNLLLQSILLFSFLNCCLLQIWLRMAVHLLPPPKPPDRDLPSFVFFSTLFLCRRACHNFIIATVSIIARSRQSHCASPTRSETSQKPLDSATVLNLPNRRLFRNCCKIWVKDCCFYKS